MKQWTIEERYRSLHDICTQEIRELKEQVDACPHRQTFHIQPPTGLLNDPNGFSYFHEKYHLFYQWFPLGPVHGLKHWYHVSSKDLVHWDDHGLAIAPNTSFDSHGVYSGTGYVHNDKLHLFYTGNVRNTDWERETYQCLAVMDKNNTITKREQPIIPEVPAGYTKHYRDPKVFKVEETYYCIIGAQRQNETGCVVYYTSSNLIDWEFQGEMETQLKEFGYMWECPDYFELAEKGILLFSPQGLKATGDSYQNIYQTGYIMGEKMDFSTGQFQHESFMELDRGFEFYAPQTMENAKGERILIGWMGLPEIEYPTDKNGWAHCLTLPRQLQWRNGRLLQKPVEALQALRKNGRGIEATLLEDTQTFPGVQGTTYELLCTFGHFTNNIGVKLRTSEMEETVIRYDVHTKKLVLDRSKSGEPFAINYGTVRQCHLDTKEIKLHIFVDTSSVEIFVNEGEEVFTSRIFPAKESTGITFFAEGEAKITAEMWDIGE